MCVVPELRDFRSFMQVVNLVLSASSVLYMYVWRNCMFVVSVPHYKQQKDPNYFPRSYSTRQFVYRQGLPSRRVSGATCYLLNAFSRSN